MKVNMKPLKLYQCKENDRSGIKTVKYAHTVPPEKKILKKP